MLIIRIHGEINISPDKAARVAKNSVYLIVAKQTNFIKRFLICKKKIMHFV